MNAGKAIYYLLSNASSVTDICGTRIYPELAEQEAPTPFVVYEVISVDPDDTNDGPAKLDEVSIDITAVADSYDTCADLASAIRSAIDRVRGTYNGVNVDSIQYSTTDTDVFDSPRRYAMTAGFIIRISRDDAQIATGQPIDLLTILRLADTPSTYGTTGQALVMNAEGDALEWGDAASALGSLTDVNLDDPQDHEALVYDQDTATWINGASTKIGIRVINQTGGPLFRGSPVKAVGVQGDQIQVALFFAASDDGKRFVGLLDSDLANGATGYARQTGMIYNLNTSAFNVGDILYPTNQAVGTLNNGLDFMQAFPPNGGAGGTPVTIAAAIVVRKHAHTGRVYVRTWTPSLSLGALDDVNLDVAVLGNPNALVYDGSKWIKGTPTMLLSSLRNVSQGTDDPPVGSILTWNNSTSEWIATPKASFLPSADAYFLNRYTFEAIAARQAADATLTIERYLSVQADGHGEELTQQTDTPTSGNKIVRKIWHKAVSFEDSDVSTWTLVHTFADDTAYADTTATFDALLTAATYGSIPFSLAQTWEDVPAFTGLLDTYSGAAAAYSLRLLDSTYTGDAIRVRRASDNAEQDIGFTDNELDTSALATFCAGTDGFVKTWYDQSGNGNHATQTTASAQPKIYDASTGVITQNGKPAAYWDGSNDYLQTTYDNANDYTAFWVQVSLSGVRGQVIGRGTSGARHVVGWSTSNSVFHYRGGAADIQASGAAAQYIGYALSKPSSADCRIGYNGTTGGTSALIGTDQLVDMVIGAERSSFTNYGNSHIQEVILYPSDQSANRSGIETNINTAFSIYGQSPTGFLADYPGAAAAYSLRQLISTATYAVAVRRSSDNAVLPIGFVNGELDTTTLAAFCSGANGFVAVWFDQSGEGNHATQTTAASQPKIYDAATGVVMENGKPATQFVSKQMTLPASIGVDFSTAWVWRSNNEAANQLVINTQVDCYYNPGAPKNYRLFFGGTLYQWTANESPAPILPSNQTAVWMNYSTSASWFMRTNGIEKSFSAGASFTPSNGVLGQFCDAQIQEVIIWNSNQSANRAGIESNINDHYSIY